jgi:mannose-1-phosphate guanylyltransferase
VARRDPEAVIAMLPADQVIHDTGAFRDVLAAAFEAACAEPWLVTIGIRPTEPATGFGYVQRGSLLARAQGREVFSVARFVEKPDVDTARRYLESGDYLWNSGMFVWSVASIRAALARHAPDIHAGLAAIEADLAAGRPVDATLAERFPSLRKISVDFGVMEKAGNVVTIPATFDWDDVGSWPSVMRHEAADANGNVLRGAAVVEGGDGNLVVSTPGHLVAVMGVDDLVVVHTPDATLVCPKSHAQRIKDLLRRLEGDARWKHVL